MFVLFLQRLSFQHFCVVFVCLFACRIVCPGPAEGGGPASAEAVRHSSCPAAVHQLSEPELVTLADLETDEATHAGRVDSTGLSANYLPKKRLLARAELMLSGVSGWFFCSLTYLLLDELRNNNSSEL